MNVLEVLVTLGVAAGFFAYALVLNRLARVVSVAVAALRRKRAARD